MFFDDIGSFPLPKGISRGWIERNLYSKEYEELVQRAFLMKAKYVEVPNYPQFRDMVSMFMDLIKNKELQDDAYLISKRYAKIVELEIVEKMDVESVRVCITGPFELYYKEFGGKIYEDVLLNLAESVKRFAKNASKYENVKCISIDEPSLGLAPDLQPEKEILERAFDYKVGCDVQIHLHSPIFYNKLLETGIDVVGVEAAKEQKNLSLLDPEMLRSYDKKVRVGVARSDIDGIVAEFNAKYNLNAWKSEELIEMAVEEVEPFEEIRSRIFRAYEIFEDLIAYIGPDCGLFSFPTQSSALKLLSNIRKALEEVRKWII
ncbi:MAG: methionine synthase [Archaeoglobaceae archaeon]|nr:methionine synthase [Archaeoglobaceae archaeon]MCX8151939.1 methionine synthase [Archaeoglobaceae archaeon]MDW8013328.1 methionine synthase [Archaeoglobaceae archaeon]